MTTSTAQSSEKNKALSLSESYKNKINIIKKYELEKETVQKILRNIFLSRKIDDTEF